ncbi:hypothetical protein HW115_11750 [Verrucomicrobiaceae bacterium N1E253]|uniref:Uncharacterized protein n=1 Tax=Oceaniferula marina TaxID=2748318 RepID=A0A851GML9_9BACT|nr:hypothetical protein [Oceaniferula marina]NWK56287.1 hypothetical protein [Oceaniferula marina]
MNIKLLWGNLAYLCIACSMNPAFAQQPEKEKKAAHARIAYVIYTGGGKFFNDPVLIRSGNKIKKVQLYKRTASPPVKFRADGKISLVKANPDDEETSYTVYAKAIVPEHMRKVLVVLTPLKKAKGDLLFSTNIIDLSKFKKGDWMFINQTPRKIGVQIGSKKLRIKPKASSVYDARAIAKPTNMPIRYSYFHPQHQKWKLLSASTCVIRPTRREICVFSWNPQSKRIDYHGITFSENG